MTRDERRQLEALLEAFPGASWTLKPGKRHEKVVLSYRNRNRMVVKSATPSGPHAADNFMADVRRTLKELAQ